jgi:hypothetical protein
MKSPALGLKVACVVFALMSLAQLTRLLVGVEVTVNGHFVPLWASGIAFVIAGGLSAWMGRLSRLGTN